MALYDDIPNVVLAYGMRRLKTSYTGNLIRLRRSSDNAEQDIGYDGSGDLDTAAAATFIGAGSGFVVTWYDQSGNGYNATQSTASAQASYILSGQNDRPVVRFNGTSNNYLLVSDANGILRNVAGSSAMMGVRANGTDITRNILFINNNTSSGARFSTRVLETRAMGVGGRRLNNDSFQVVTSDDNVYTVGEFWIQNNVIDYSNASAYVYKNGDLVASTTSFQTPGNTADTDSNRIRLGSNGSNTASEFWAGDMAEILVANVAWSDTDRDDARAIMEAYWFESDSDDLTAIGIATGAPVFDTPALAQLHELAATGVTASQPENDTPALTQLHALSADGIATDSPTLDSPTLTQTHSLAATGLTAGAASVDSVTLAQLHQLAATGLTAGAATFGEPELAELDGSTHALTATGITAGQPTTGAPVIAQTHSMAAAAFATGAPTLGTPALLIAGVIIAHIRATMAARGIVASFDTRVISATFSRRNITWHT